MKLSEICKIVEKLKKEANGEDLDIFIKNKIFDCDCNQTGSYHLEILQISIQEEPVNGPASPAQKVVIIDQH